MFNIQNKVAVVTGGGGVLGSNISKGLLQAGAKVIILDIRGEVLEQKIADLKQYGEVSGMVCNVLDEDSLKSVREQIENDFGGIDILVNAAGGNMPGGTLTEEQTIFDMKMEDYNKVVNLNSNGTVYPCLIFGESMARQGSGSIINVSSMATYSAISRVPGFFIGDQNRAVLINPDGSLTERSKKVIAKTPMKRFGNIDELNGIVQFLCSDAASFITGAIIPVDGGFSAFSGV